MAVVHPALAPLDNLTHQVDKVLRLFWGEEVVQPAGSTYVGGTVRAGHAAAGLVGTTHKKARGDHDSVSIQYWPAAWLLMSSAW
jgi:hypothetical protein